MSNLTIENLRVAKDKKDWPAYLLQQKSIFLVTLFKGEKNNLLPCYNFEKKLPNVC